MPIRKDPLVTNEIYHIFNKTLFGKRPFEKPTNSHLFMGMVEYYRSRQNPGSYSRFLLLPTDTQSQILETISHPDSFYVDLLVYCLMPNHFHFLLKQKVDGGISKFMGNISNSFTRHVNLEMESLGPIFLPRFKSVPIRSEEQLMHVSRYIQLNPYSSGLVKSIDEIFTYPWSSIAEYLNGEHLCSTKEILGYYPNNSDQRKLYESFLRDQADYQRTLELLRKEQKI